MIPLGELTHRDQLGTWLSASGLTGAGVEIGVYAGANAAQILSTWPGVLFLVDPWESQDAAVYCETHIDHGATEKLARERLAPFGNRVGFFKLTSDSFFEHIKGTEGRFDFIYIDGNHSGEQVKRDIENSWALLKPGGLMGGHDWFESIVDGVGAHCAEIAPIVKAFAADHGLALHLTTEDFPVSWWLRK